MSAKYLLKNYKYLQQQVNLVGQLREQLSPDLQQLMDMAFIKELPPEVICQELCISESTMYRRKRIIIEKCERVIKHKANGRKVNIN